MATIFIDGFDKYGVVTTNNNNNTPLLTTLLTEGEWNNWGSSGLNPYNLVTGLSPTGYALKIGPQATSTLFISKVLPASYTRLIGGFRFQSDLGGIVGVSFQDNGTNQCSIGVTSTGAIRLYNGLFSATIVATSSVTVTANTTHYLEWDITFGSSASFNVYLDGVSVFSGSTGNTKTTANASANGIAFVQNSSNPAGALTVDDLYLFDPNTGSTNIAVLNTNPRIETRFPNSDSQTQWTNAGTVIVPINVSQTGVTTTANNNQFAGGSNIIAVMKITPAVSCTLQSVGFLPQTTNGIAKFKSVLYSDSSGSPNTLLATGTETVGVIAATALTLPFGSGQSLTGGTTYWIGLITDTAINYSVYDNNGKGVEKGNTYGSGAPNPYSTVNASSSFLFWGNATGATTNWETVGVNPANGPGPAADNGTITSSTVSNEDLYGFPALSVTANLIYTIAVKGNMKLPSGFRTVDLRLNSAGTDSGGTNTGQTPGNGYTWLSTYFDTNPHGGAWTTITANAATAGPKVAS